MELYVRICIVLLGTFLYSNPRFHECRKLEGYKFPVYSTESCPGNESEWNKRSSALNCNETYGYTCLPNEKFTELLEFCYTEPRIRIEEGVCLVLVKKASLVHAYECHKFIYGCPSSSYFSTNIFDYPACIGFENGCFFAEPTCKRNKTNVQDTSDHLHLENVTLKKHDGKTTPYPQKTTTQIATNLQDTSDHLHLENVTLKKHDGKTTSYPQKTTTQIATENVQTNNNNLLIIIIIIGTVLGALFLVSVFYMGLIYSVARKKPLPFQKQQICQWKRENSNFFSTQACKEVKQRIQDQRVVMVIGHPGTGKSAIIQHIGLQYKKAEWTLKPLQSITDFMEAYSDKTKTIFIINDPFGKGDIKAEECEVWRSNEQVIKYCLTRSYSILLMSCRKHIFLDTRIKRLFEDCSCVVDINKVEYKLTNDEKRQLLSKYTTDMDFAVECANQVEIEAYFPRLCKLYSEKREKEGLRYFLEPEEVLNSELMCLRDENRELFCALIILAISRDNFCMEHLQDIVCSKQSEYISKECGINEIMPSSIMEKLDSVDGFLVKKKNPDNTDFTKNTYIYVFYNEVVQRVIESCFEDIITRIKKKL